VSRYLVQPWQEILEIEPRGSSDPGHQAFLHEPGGVEGREKGPQHDVGELMAIALAVTRGTDEHEVIERVAPAADRVGPEREELETGRGQGLTEVIREVVTNGRRRRYGKRVGQ